MLQHVACLLIDKGYARERYLGCSAKTTVEGWETNSGFGGLAVSKQLTENVMFLWYPKET